MSVKSRIDVRVVFAKLPAPAGRWFGFASDTSDIERADQASLAAPVKTFRFTDISIMQACEHDR
jgi:hypothetical protein